MWFWGFLKWVGVALVGVLALLVFLIWKAVPDSAPRHADHVYCDMAITILGKMDVGSTKPYRHVGPCGVEVVAVNVRRVSGLYETPLTRYKDSPALPYMAIVARDERHDVYALCRFGLVGDPATVRSDSSLCSGY